MKQLLQNVYFKELIFFLAGNLCMHGSGQLCGMFQANLSAMWSDLEHWSIFDITHEMIKIQFRAIQNSELPYLLCEQI